MHTHFIDVILLLLDWLEGLDLDLENEREEQGQEEESQGRGEQDQGELFICRRSQLLLSFIVEVDWSLGGGRGRGRGRASLKTATERTGMRETL